MNTKKPNPISISRRHQRKYLPNYRCQRPPTIAMMLRQVPCCAACSRVTVYGQKCHCNVIRGKMPNAALGIESRVEYYGICNKYKDGKVIIHGRELSKRIRTICEGRKTVGEDEIQSEHGRNSVGIRVVHPDESGKGHAPSRLGAKNNLRIPLIEENKTLTITIP